MLTVEHDSSRKSNRFYDHYFSVTGLPMTNSNTVIISEALNDNAKYFEGMFSAKPNGSCYTISVRGPISRVEFSDVAEIREYILMKLNSCNAKLEERG